MFTRAIVDHQTTKSASAFTSSQQLLKFSQPSVQKTLDFTGVKRKALEVINETNKRPAVEPIRNKPKSNLIAALNNVDSFNERKGHVFLDGDVFNEADFEDFEDDDWEIPLTAQAGAGVPTNTEVPRSSGSKANPIVIDQDDDQYFQDCDDLDWDTAADISRAIRGQLPSSPPEDIPTQVLPPQPREPEDKENNIPSTFPPPQTEDRNLGKLLFPSSQPLSWSPSPPHVKQPPKRTLPWQARPSRYAPPIPSTSSRPNSIPHHSGRTIATAHPLTGQRTARLIRPRTYRTSDLRPSQTRKAHGTRKTPRKKGDRLDR
jgi:hypothetical protein